MSRLKSKLVWKGLLILKKQRTTLGAATQRSLDLRPEDGVADRALSASFFSAVVGVPVGLLVTLVVGMPWWWCFTPALLVLLAWVSASLLVSAFQKLVIPLGEAYYPLENLLAKSKNFEHLTNNTFLVNEAEVESLKAQVKELCISSIAETLTYEKKYRQGLGRSTSERERKHLLTQRQEFHSVLKERAESVETAHQRVVKLLKAAEESAELQTLRDDRELGKLANNSDQAHELLKTFSDEINTRVQSLEEANQELREAEEKAASNGWERIAN